MVGRGELTEGAWSVIAPLFPTNGGRCGQWRDHCTIINGILWKLRTGAPWRDLPDRNRLKQWRGLGIRYENRATNYRAMVVLRLGS